MVDELNNRIASILVHWEKHSEFEEAKYYTLNESLANMQRDIDEVNEYKSGLMTKFEIFKGNVFRILSTLRVCENLNARYKALCDMMTHLESIQEDFEDHYEDEEDNCYEDYYEYSIKLHNIITECISEGFSGNMDELDENIRCLDNENFEHTHLFNQQMTINDEQEIINTEEDAKLKYIQKNQKLEIIKYKEMISNSVNEYKNIELFNRNQRNDMKIRQIKLDLIKKENGDKKLV